MAITVNELLNAIKISNIQQMMDELVTKLDQLKNKESELRSDLEELDRLKKKLS